MKIIITERQEDLLMEGLPVSIRRRINYRMIKDHLDFSILESVNPCDYTTPGDFITEMCDMLVVDLIDDYYYENGIEIDSKTKDDLYFFMVDNFADYLQELYDKECS